MSGERMGRCQMRGELQMRDEQLDSRGVAGESVTTVSLILPRVASYPRLDLQNESGSSEI